jgi:hypothetical protein
LLRGDPTQAHTLVGKEDRGSGQQKLAELENRIEPPTLEKQDATAQQADGGKKHVVITGQRWFEAPHEIEEGTAHGQDDANDAGPVQAGINQGTLSS